jgi:hypothetical protein
VTLIQCNTPNGTKIDLTTESAIKATIAMVICTSVAYVATHTQNLFRFASAIIIGVIGVIGVIIGTYKTPPHCAVETN